MGFFFKEYISMDFYSKNSFHGQISWLFKVFLKKSKFRALETSFRKYIYQMI